VVQVVHAVAVRVVDDVAIVDRVDLDRVAADRAVTANRPVTASRVIKVDRVIKVVSHG
jgi:hypothetical protein